MTVSITIPIVITTVLLVALIIILIENQHHQTTWSKLIEPETQKSKSKLLNRSDKNRPHFFRA